MLHIPIFHIDTNVINSNLENDDMNKLEQWAKDEIIQIIISGTSYKEAKVTNYIPRIKKADQNIFTLTDVEIDENDSAFHTISIALFPNGIKNDNQKNDVKIVYEAMHYNAILITLDGNSKKQPGGILGNRDKIKNIVQIMNPKEAVQFIETKIEEHYSLLIKN
jgi:hypothetical protein